MESQLIKISLDCYGAFLQASNLQVNQLASAFVEFNGGSLVESLNEGEEFGLVKNSRLTPDGSMIANIICCPQKSIVASNSSFGPVPICVFSFKNGFWAFTAIDFLNKTVNLVAPVPQDRIADLARNALMGDKVLSDIGYFDILLSEDEITLLSLVLLWLKNRKENLNKPLSPEDALFDFQDLIMAKELASMAFLEEKVWSSNNVYLLVNEPSRCRKAFDGLLEKQILAKTQFEGYCLPGPNLMNWLMPEEGLSVINYYDLETKKSRKYYLYTSHILELMECEGQLRICSVQDLDYSLF